MIYATLGLPWPPQWYPLDLPDWPWAEQVKPPAAAAYVAKRSEELESEAERSSVSEEVEGGGIGKDSPTLLDLAPGQCRFPLDERARNGLRLYCAAHVEWDCPVPYCSVHRLVMYRVRIPRWAGQKF